MEHNVKRRRRHSLLLAVMLALWASIASVQLASPSYASSSAVTWSVDRSAKIIKVTVNLTFTGRHLGASASLDELFTFQQRVTDIDQPVDHCL